MARILLHSLVYSPDGVSTAYLMTDLCRELRRLGHEVLVLTTTPHYNVERSSLQRQPLQAVWKNFLYRSRCDGIDVWHVHIPTKGEKVAGRTLDYLRFHLLSALAAAVKLPRYDVVLAPSPPLTIGVMARCLGSMRRVPAIYNVQEIYPDFLVNQGLVTSRALIAVLRRIERFVYRRCDAIVPISDWFRRTVEARGVRPDIVRVIPNFVDTHQFCPLPRANGFAMAHGLVDRFVMLYAGNIGLSQDWESLLFAADGLRALPILFLVVGDGVRRQWLEAEVRRRALPNVRLMDYQPRDVVPEMYASSDLCTIPMKSGSTRDTFPSKIYTIMACGRSTLASADSESELAWIIQDARAGRCVPPEDPLVFREAVRKAFEERHLLPVEGERGRERVVRDYSKEAVAEKYHALITSLVG